MKGKLDVFAVELVSIVIQQAQELMGCWCSTETLFELPAAKGEDMISFDREIPPVLFGDHDNLTYAEGYWKGGGESGSDSYPLPIKGDPWIGEDEFIEKLRQVESTMTMTRFRGCSTSRITGESLGNGEYHDHNFRVMWPQDLRPHYYQRHHVKPSRLFFRYIHHISK